MTEDITIQEILEKVSHNEGKQPLAVAVRFMVDNLLTECAGRDLFSTSELADRLLDIRSLLNQHIAGEGDENAERG